MAVAPTRVLIVDSRSDWRERVSRAFERVAGPFELCGAADLATARVQLRERRPDLLIASWRLPDGGALDLLPDPADAPFATLIVDRAGEPRAAVAAMRAGAHDYLADDEALLGELPARADAALREWRQRHERQLAERALRAENAELHQRLAACADELADQARRMAEAQYRALVEQLPAAVYLAPLDNASHTSYVSPPVELLLGYTLAEWRDQPDLWPRLLHPGDRDRVLAQLDQAILSTQPLCLEYRMLARDGRVVWLRDEAKIVYDEAGRPLLQGVLLDITERVLAERRSTAFSALGQRLNAATNASEAARVVAATADEILGWDAFVLTLYSAEQDAVEQVLMYDLIDGQRSEIAPKFQVGPATPLQRYTIDHGARLFNLGDPLLHELTPEFFGDEERSTEALMFAPIRRDAKVVGVLSIQSYAAGAYTAADLEMLQALADHIGGALERIQAEQQRHASEQRYRALFEHASDALFLEDTDDRIVDVNPRACELLGYTREELLALRVPDVMAPELRQPDVVLSELSHAAAGPFESINVHRDGRRIPIEIACAPFHSPGGVLMFSIVRDITERKRAEAQQQFLSEASALLGNSLEPEVTLTTFTRLAVPFLADWCAVHLLQPDQSIRRVAEHFDDPAKQTRIEAFNRLRPRGQAGDEGGYVAVIRTGQPVREPDLLAAVATLGLPQLEQHLRDLEFSSFMSVPLIARGRTFGALSFGALGSGRHYGPADQALAEQLAYRAALAIDNARLFAELRDSQSRYQSVVENVREIIFQTEVDGAITFLNPAWATLTGFSIEQSLGQDMCEFVHPDERAGVRAVLGELVAGTRDECNAEIRFRTSGGQYRWAVIQARPRLDAGRRPIGTLGTLQDVTQRQQAESALRESEERFRTLIQDLHVGVLLQGPSAEVLLSNPAALRLLGLTEDQLLGLTSFDPAWNVSHEDGSPFSGPDHPVPQAIATRRPVRDVVMGVFRPAIGDRVWLLVNAEPQLTAEGEVRQVVCTFSDITERRQIEAQLRASQQLLQQIINYAPMTIVIQAVEDGRYLLVNRAMQEATGRSEAELLSLRASDVDAPIAALWRGPDLQIASTGQPLPIEDEVIYADGTSHTLLGLKFPLYNDHGEIYAVGGIFADITARKQAEQAVRELNNTLERRVEERTQALRSAEARYRMLVEQLPAITYISSIDAHDHTLYISPQVETMLGYRPSEWIGEPDIWKRYMHPDDRPRIQAEQARAYSEGRPRPTEYRLIARDGRVRWFRDEAVYLDDDSGSPRVVQGILYDITERKQAEQALRESNRNLQLIAENTADVIYAYDMDRRLLYVNPAFETLTGYTVAELWEQHFIPYMHPDDAERMQQLFDNCFRGQMFSDVEYRMLMRDGTVKWCAASGGPLFDITGAQIGVQGRERDISERKRADEALRMSELRYRTLIERMSEGLLQADEHDVIQFANASFCQLLGYTPDELVGQVALDLLLRAEDRDFMFEINRQRGRGVSDKYEIQLRKKSGELIWVQISGAPVIDAAGKVIGTIGVHTDIGERRRMEATLAEERALLALRVEERTAELRAVNTELARAARLKDEFLASMSHELRTPLNTILGMSETMAEQIYGPVTGEQSEALESILESGRHLLALINDILDLSKIEADQLSLELGPVLVDEICQSSLIFVRQTAQQKRLRLDLEIDPQVHRIQADARRLMQMLVNLLSNAVKFTPDGGTVRLEVAGDSARQQVQFSVTDTGIGIAPADLGRLFQPFIQLDSRLARQYTGTGLGLALVARMARLHGGSVAVDSTLGQGSRFTISLPWHELSEADPAGDASLAEPIDALPELPIAHVLILEDSPAAAAQVARYLDELGIGSTIHTRGATFFDKVLELRPELIILDIQLPDLSGWNVLAQLKADPRTRPIPVLILSVVDDVARGLALGAAEYLVKPIARPQLIRALRKLGGLPGPAAPPEPPPAPPEPPPARPRILLADDNPDNKMMFSRYLRAKGYDVVLAENGPQAIALAAAAPPDLILMDIQMPEIDGLEATRQIRAIPALARVPIVALTALAMPGDRERCLAAGMDDYLSKPIVLQSMLDMINAHIARAAARETDEHH